MKKLVISVKMMDGASVVEETNATYDLAEVPTTATPRATQSGGNTVGLVMQLRRLFRRELIRRSLIVAEAEDGRQR